MNIIHIVPSLSLGGLQKFAVDLANEQIIEGHNVSIIILENSGNNDLLDKCDSGIDIFNLGCSTNFYNFLLMLKIYKIIRSGESCVVHTHGIALYFSLIASLLIQESNFIHTVHNLAQNEAGKVRRAFARFSYRCGLAFPVTISDEVSESFRDYYPKISFRQINNGVSSHIKFNIAEKESAKRDLDALKFNADTKIYLTVGRIDHQKNRAMLLDAFYEYSKQRNVVLAIIGGPVDMANLYYAPLVEHSAVKENKVHFLGLKTNVHDYLDYSDFFCLTSLFEGLPISALEAIRAGLVCICTPAGGLQSLLKDMGYLSSGFSTNEFVTALIYSENNPKGLLSGQLKSYFTNNWDMNVCAAGYLSQYRILNGN
jgi:glycosyltransferase involved in cell wall biosynthesis